MMGDPANDVPPGSDPALYDRAQREIGKYHGGDFRGLEIALKSGYFHELGVTALWISPPVKNVWNSTYDLGGAKTGYHGYWAQDFLDIDPHLTSSHSHDGAREYPDTRDGRMQHYRDFVALAHVQGIKIVQDIVCNHTGPTFFYDANGNGKFDTGDKAEWVQPYKRDGNHENAKWADLPAWNQVHTEPAGPQTILGREVKTTGILAKLETYGRKGFSDGSLGKSDGEEVMCDFFSLRDIWTAPDSPHFDALVNEFVEIYAFYIYAIGVDGLRIDTVKHVHHEFWDAFTERLRARVGPERAKRLLLFGKSTTAVLRNSANTRTAWTIAREWSHASTRC
jgi:glycosidase